jgi:hypothetical protein
MTEVIEKYPKVWVKNLPRDTLWVAAKRDISICYLFPVPMFMEITTTTKTTTSYY